jgi:hypothetical protein
MKKPKQEKTLEELLENQNKLTGEELGRLALLTYAEEMTATRSDREPVITRAEYTEIYNRILDTATGRRKRSLTVDSARELFFQQKLEHAARTSEILIQGAFNRFYTYLYCLMQDANKETSRSIYLTTPVILSPERYSALVKTAGGETLPKLADAYAPNWQTDNRARILHERAAFVGFAVMQQAGATEIDKVIEESINRQIGNYDAAPGPFLEDDQRREIFSDFIFAMAYYFRLKEILITLGESYQIENLPDIIRQDMTENFIKIIKNINDTIDSIEALRKETGQASAILGANYWKVNIEAVTLDDKEKELLKALYSRREYMTDINLESNIKRRAAELTAAELGRLQNNAEK